MDGGGGTPRPVLLTGAKKSHLGCSISFELRMGFLNFVVINKIHPLKKKRANETYSEAKRQFPAISRNVMNAQSPHKWWVVHS